VDTFAPRQSGGLREPHGVLFGPHHNHHVRKASEPLVAGQFVLKGPANVYLGQRFNVTVTAEDAAGNVATDYRGTVHFTDSTGHASLPGDYTFTDADQGRHEFSNLAILGGRGDNITVRDTQNPDISGRIGIGVIPRCC
jgi:hypothetical protein